MSIGVYKPGDRATLIRALIYGDPKTGKTRLATAFDPSRGKVVYVAAEPGSAELDSVMAKYRENLIVVVPGIDTLDEKGNVKKKADYEADVWGIAKTDWAKKLGEPVQAIVWDTWTFTARRLLASIAASAQFSDKHVKIDLGGGDDLAIAMEGDFGAVMNLQENVVVELSKRPYDVILLCHTKIRENKQTGAIMAAGPDTIGKAALSSFAGLFSQVFFLTRKSVASAPGKPAVQKFVVNTVPQGIWTAGVRSAPDGGENPMPTFEVPAADPGAFWTAYRKNFIEGAK